MYMSVCLSVCVYMYVCLFVLCVSVRVCLAVFSVSLFVLLLCASIACVYILVSVYPSRLSVHLLICLSVYLFFRLVCLPICVCDSNVYLSVFLPVLLSAHLSIIFNR